MFNYSILNSMVLIWCNDKFSFLFWYSQISFKFASKFSLSLFLSVCLCVFQSVSLPLTFLKNLLQFVSENFLHLFNLYQIFFSSKSVRLNKNWILESIPKIFNLSEWQLKIKKSTIWCSCFVFTSLVPNLILYPLQLCSVAI